MMKNVFDLNELISYALGKLFLLENITFQSKVDIN